ncbi:MAG: cytochrome c biogenesis CcdA family protein [Methylocella sp.]
MTLVLAFFAGVLSILSPCVLPLAPIVIAGAGSKDPRGPIALALGLALTFGVVGGTIASFGVELGATGALRSVAAAIMVAVGLIMLVPALSLVSERALAPLARWSEVLSKRLPEAGLLGSFAAGIVLAFAWAPCVGPTLGAAFALAASGGSLAAAMATMFVFALGAALSLLAAGFGLGRLAAKGRFLTSRAARFGQAALAIVLIVAGGAILTGLDRKFEAAVLQATPDWFVALTTRI